VNSHTIHDTVVINKIRLIRGQKVILDKDLAELYGVETRRLNEQVKRNPDRFPEDFMFQLTESELEILMSQIATSSSKWGGRRKLPYAFTEHGVLMLSSVLNSPTAIQVNIQIVRVYSRLREMLSTHKDVLIKLDKLEKNIFQQEKSLDKHEKEIRLVFSTLRKLVTQPKPERKQIGYKAESKL
jgi:hypothetical protein